MALKNSRVFPLDEASLGQVCLVSVIHGSPEAPEWGQWLEDIGFIPGEQVTVLARGRPGGDPLVVRVGLSTFALRRAEAACIDVGIGPLPASQGIA